MEGVFERLSGATINCQLRTRKPMQLDNCERTCDSCNICSAKPDPRLAGDLAKVSHHVTDLISATCSHVERVLFTADADGREQ